MTNTQALYLKSGMKVRCNKDCTSSDFKVGRLYKIYRKTVLFRDNCLIHVFDEDGDRRERSAYEFDFLGCSRQNCDHINCLGRLLYD
jgi:hypothetical protein